METDQRSLGAQVRRENWRRTFDRLKGALDALRPRITALHRRAETSRAESQAILNARKAVAEKDGGRPCCPYTAQGDHH